MADGRRRISRIRRVVRLAVVLLAAVFAGLPAFADPPSLRRQGDPLQLIVNGEGASRVRGTWTLGRQFNEHQAHRGESLQGRRQMQRIRLNLSR